MKKLYIQPATMLVRTETEVMVCYSYNPTANSDPTSEQGNGANALSKRRGIFDDGESGSDNGIW